MITAKFSDGKVSHEVHTRGEALELINRYWPMNENHSNLGVHLIKIGDLFEQSAKECMKENLPAIYGYMLNEKECIIGGYGNQIQMMKVTNKIQERTVFELEKELAMERGDSK